MNFVYQNGKPIELIIGRKLSEAQEFLLRASVEDSKLYANAPLLETWSEVILAENTLKRLDYTNRTWQERAGYCRRNNIIKDILQNLN